jgi:hypothetical protein
MSGPTEQQKLHDMLLDFTYENFQHKLKDWFKSGRMVWLAYGNLTSDQGESIVEQSRKTLDLKTISKD